MGDVRRYLYRGELAHEAPRMYADKRSLELAETLHHHERNARLEYTPEGFDRMCEAVARAHAKWRAGGSRPESAKTVYLDLSSIPAVPGVTPTRFEVELSMYPTLPHDTVHVHLRNLRLEFTPAEFREFAAGITAASAALGG